MQIESHSVQQGQARIECLQALGLPILKEQQKHVSSPVNEHSLLQNHSSFSIGNIQQKMGGKFPRGMFVDLNEYVALLFYPFCQLPFPVFLC